MKILDKYLLKRYFTYFLSAEIVFVTIFLLVELIEKIDNFLDYDLSFLQVIYYFIFTIPWFIHIAIPMSSLIAVVFSLGKLIKFYEFVALKSSGISLYRIAVPLLIVGLFTSFFAFEFEDRIVVPSHQKMTEFKKEYMTRNYRKKKDEIQRNIYLQLNDGSFLNIRYFNINNNEGNFATIQKFKNNIISTRYDAKKMFWKNNKWVLKDVQIREFANTKEIYIPKDSLIVSLGITPKDLLQKNINPDNMTFAQLQSFVKKMDKLGINSIKWRVNLFFKTSMNFTSFIVILFGISIVTFQTKSGGPGGSIAISLLVIFIFYSTLMYGKLVGIAGEMPPFISVWFSNIFFFVLGIILLLGAKK